MTPASSEDILSFWRAAGYEKWFNKDDAFDHEVRARFLATYDAAVAGRLRHWENAPEGALALVIVLDQFPRNMFRCDAKTFAADPLAREVAARALDSGYDKRVPRDLQSFFYLPLMHSEEHADQERCVALYRALGDENGLKYALLHEEIIRRFGRFPHRNRMLGRETTEEEQTFLDGGGFAG